MSPTHDAESIAFPGHLAEPGVDLVAHHRVTALTPLLLGRRVVWPPGHADAGNGERDGEDADVGFAELRFKVSKLCRGNMTCIVMPLAFAFVSKR